MKLVDENGKLFKKFNLVDAIVVVLVVAILAALGWKIIGASRTAAEERRAAELAAAYETAPHLVYEVICPDTPKALADAFVAQAALPKEERQMMSNGSPVEGYIMDCRMVPHDDDALYDVYFSLEALLIDKDDKGIYSVGSQEVRIGKSHIVKTYSVEATGFVTAMATTGEVTADE